MKRKPISRLKEQLGSPQYPLYYHLENQLRVLGTYLADRLCLDLEAELHEQFHVQLWEQIEVQINRKLNDEA
jgi:hypothetical protein